MLGLSEKSTAGMRPTRRPKFLTGHENARRISLPGVEMWFPTSAEKLAKPC
jgi:hypothetical protein